MTPSSTERIDAVSTKGMTPAQVQSMLNYLLGSLAALAGGPLGTSNHQLADAVERAHEFGSLSK